MLNRLKQIDVILTLLILLSINSLRDINIAQAIVSLGIFGLFAYNRYMAYIKKPDLAKELREEIDHLNSKVSGLVVKNAAKPQQNEFKVRF